jgi:hypothetical protein
LQRLEASTERCLNAVDTEFAEIIAKIEKRRTELQAAVTAAARDKKHVLEEQQELIENEKMKVEAECEGLQYQVVSEKKIPVISFLVILHYITKCNLEGGGPEYYTAH